jgi:hypothetical protein
MAANRVRFVLRAALLVVVVVCLPLPLQQIAAAAPEGCIVHGFTADFQSMHFSHIESGALMVGGLVVIESDCGPFTVAIDGVPLVGGEERVSLDVPLSTRSITVTASGGGNWSVEWDNLSFMPGSDFAQALDLLAGEQERTGALSMTAADLESRELMVAVGTGFIVWLCTVTVLHRVISWWHDRHFIEEVTE